MKVRSLVPSETSSTPRFWPQPKWIARLALLLSTASTRVLINGSPGDQFWHARGLRQGDPMSPLMFVVEAEDAQLFGSFAPWGIRHRLSDYADDVVLLIRPDVHEATAAVGLLEVFGAASGLNCNLSKGSASLIRCDAVQLSETLRYLVCPMKFSVRYFGIPLSVARLSKACCWTSSNLESVSSASCGEFRAAEFHTSGDLNLSDAGP